MSSPDALVWQRFPGAQEEIAVSVATQERVLPALTEHIDVWTVLVVEQRRVPVVMELVLVVEELELELVVVEEVVEAVEVVEPVEDAVLALFLEVFESEVVDSVVVEAAALEGAAVEDAAAEDAAAEDSVFSVDCADFVLSDAFLSVVVSVAESVFESEASARLLNSTRSSSFRTSARYLWANHTAPTVASALEHPPAL